MNDSRLILIGLSLERVDFELERPGETRRVSVHVGSGPRWAAAANFPHAVHEDGCTTGDDQLDASILRRASEELVRLHASVMAERIDHAAA